MIITKKKQMEEIDEMIKPFPKLFIVGCGTCSTSCMTGGEEQVQEMDEGRLEVFKDFVDSLDLDDMDTEGDSDE